MTEGADGSLQTVPEKQGAQLAPGLAIYRFGASLYYANATRFTAEVMDLVEDAQTRRCAGSCISAARPSATSTTRAPTRCARSRRSWRAKGVTLALADLNPRVRNRSDEYGLTDKIGDGNIYDSIRDAVKAHSGSAGGAAAAEHRGRRTRSAGGASATPSSP